MSTYYLLFFVSIGITLIAQILVSVRYKKYSKVKNSKGIAGYEAAQEILKASGLDDVYVVEVKGYLSDHYDPSQRVVRLSTDVYHGKTLSSVAIAAHECGHAIQHKEGNFFMKLRSFIVPIVNISSKLGYFAILIGAVLGVLNLIWLGIIMLCAILFFELITLPVEFDASKKAMVNLEKYGILASTEKSGSRKVLVAAALTYVASMITTLIEILRLVLIFVGDDR